MNKSQNNKQAAVRRVRKPRIHPLMSADPPRMLPKPFVPFQVSFDVGSITLGLLRQKINQTVLAIPLEANFLSLEVRLGAIGVWELTGGDASLTIIDPINVISDNSGTVTNDTNSLFSSTDFPARNKWAHLYYRYKPEVHNRSVRLDEGVASTNQLLRVTSTATAPKIHIQIFGSWRVPTTIV
jgi:hypothetical protein